LVTSASFNINLPCVGSISLKSIFIIVDLPAPLEPTKKAKSPYFIIKFFPCIFP